MQQDSLAISSPKNQIMNEANNNSDSPLDLKNIEALTFDCYGTLIDWESGIYTALKPILENHNIELTRDETLELYSAIEPKAQSAIYKPYRNILSEVVQLFGVKLDFKPSLEETLSLAESIANWPPFADTNAALHKLKQDYKLAIVSNIDNDLIKLSASQLDVEFDWIITAQNARAYKPDLRVFQHAFEQMQLDTTQILHIAQSIFHDITPANELELQSVWVNRRRGLKGTGATPPAEAHPTLEVGSLAELAEILT